MSALEWIASAAFIYLLYETVQFDLYRRERQRGHRQRLDAACQEITQGLLRRPFPDALSYGPLSHRCSDWAEREYIGLIQQSSRVRDLAPVVGITFTTLSLLVLTTKQGQAGGSLDPSQLMSGVGVALITTALGSAFSGCHIRWLSQLHAEQQTAYQSLMDQCLPAVQSVDTLSTVPVVIPDRGAA